MAEKKKALKEFLEDDQEPFHLNHHISNLRSQLGCSDLRVNKRKSDNVTTAFPPSFFSCENSCFFTAHKSPDPRKSPLFELCSPLKKKTRDGRVFLQVPARTAAILLDAAARIQKQQSSEKTKTNKAKTRGNGFGMFGSVLKLLTNRKSKPRLDNGNAISLERGSEPTSSSSRRERFVEIGETCFCESPFHFVLHTSPSSSGHQTPHFTSTVTSPVRRSTEEDDSDETERLEKVRGQTEENKEEDDKDQCSPVSVLDPLEEEEEDEDEEDHHQHEADQLSCSFEVVQRAKRRLLRKLRRFEKLAGLDPVELEGKMLEEDEEESEEEDNVRSFNLDEEYEDVDEAILRNNGYVQEKRMKNAEKLNKWRMMNSWRLGLGMEEEVEMVVGKYLREEAGEWTRHDDEVENAVSDLEQSIFFVLIDEFSHELVSSSV